VNTLNDNLTSTKFIFAMFALFLAFVLVCFQYVTGEQFLTFVNVLGGSYILGNVVAKFADRDSAD